MKDGVKCKDGGKLSLGSVPGLEPAVTAADITALERSIEEANRYHVDFNSASQKVKADMEFLVDTLAARSHDQAVSNAIARLRRILDNEDPVEVYS